MSLRQSKALSGPAQHFDGSDDYIAFANTIVPLGVKSVSGWILRETGPTWGTVLCDCSGISSSDSGLGWALHPEYTLQCYLGNGYESGHYMQLYMNNEQSTWHYYVMTYDGTTLKGYLDGQLSVSSTEKSGSEGAPTENLRMGASTAPGLPWPFQGILDEFSVSTTALSPEWIQTSYNTMKYPIEFISVGPEETP